MRASRSRLLRPMLVALLGLAACSTPEPEPAPSERLVEEGAGSEVDAEDAEGLPDVGALGEDYPEEPTPLGPDEPVLQTATSEYGEHLVDADGRALYVSIADPPNESRCTDECVERWPILSTTVEEPEVSEELDADLAGTIDRESVDGTRLRQVTYGEKPLYYYRDDRVAGEPLGQGQGETWFLMSPDGTALREDAAGDS